MEWSKLIGEGLTIPGFPHPAGATAGELSGRLENVPQFPATFFGLTAMHMLHVTIGVIYLGVVAFRKWFLPVLGVLWIARIVFSDSVRQRLSLSGIHALGLGLLVSAVILFLTPKDYDRPRRVWRLSGRVRGHLVDLGVELFIFPLVSL